GVGVLAGSDSVVAVAPGLPAGSLDSTPGPPAVGGEQAVSRNRTRKTYDTRRYPVMAVPLPSVPWRSQFWHPPQVLHSHTVNRKDMADIRIVARVGARWAFPPCPGVSC